MVLTKKLCLPFFLICLISCSISTNENDEENNDENLFIHPSDNYLRTSDYIKPSYTISGNTYYVSITGSDDNSGDELNPWRTIQKAAWSLNPGDICYIKSGTYYEDNILFTNSGTESQPIILSAYKSEGTYDDVIIDGSQSESEWATGILFRNSQSNFFIEGIIIQNMHNHGLVFDDDINEQYKNIHLYDITTRYNGIPITSGGHGIRLNGVDTFYIDSVSSYGNTGPGISIMGSEIGDLYSQNGFIINSTAYDNDDGFEGDNCESDGINVNQGNTILIANCVSYNNNDHGFDVSDWPKGGKVSYNISLENNVSFNNRNCAFAVNSDSHHILMYKNLGYDNGYGFWVYGGGGHIDYFNNVSIRNRYGFYIEDAYAVFEDPGDNTITFANNITYNCDLQLTYSPALMVPGYNYDITAYNNNWQIPDGLDYMGEHIAVLISDMTYTPDKIETFGKDNLSTDPYFTNGDISPPDITLKPESSLIDNGIPIYINGVMESYNGSAPDIGVIEYQSP